MIKTEFFGTFKSEYELKHYLSLPSHCIDGEPSVYVGTYAKYNGGSLEGRWVTITNFDTYEEFMEFCRLLHRDECDPELMFQDYENFPRELYSESGMGEENFNKIKVYGEKDEDGREAYDAFVYCFGDTDFERFDDCYQGQWDDMEDFAYYLVDELGYLSQMPDNLRCYFDYKAFARDLSIDYCEHNGHVFRNC